MNSVTLVEENSAQIGTILSGDSGDERAACFSHVGSMVESPLSAAEGKRPPQRIKSRARQELPRHLRVVVVTLAEGRA